PRIQPASPTRHTPTPLASDPAASFWPPLNPSKANYHSSTSLLFCYRTCIGTAYLFGELRLKRAGRIDRIYSRSLRHNTQTMLSYGAFKAFNPDPIREGSRNSEERGFDLSLSTINGIGESFFVK